MPDPPRRCQRVAVHLRFGLPRPGRTHFPHGSAARLPAIAGKQPLPARTGREPVHRWHRGRHRPAGPDARGIMGQRQGTISRCGQSLCVPRRSRDQRNHVPPTAQRGTTSHRPQPHARARGCLMEIPRRQHGPRAGMAGTGLPRCLMDIRKRDVRQLRSGRSLRRGGRRRCPPGMVAA